MSQTLKILLAALMLFAAGFGYMLTKTHPQSAWDGTALLARADKALEALPAKEAGDLRALLVSTGPKRYDDRVDAWFRTSLKDELKPVSEYALASLRAMAQEGDAEAMYYLHFVLTQRIATADEGFEWLHKAASLGQPSAVFKVTEHDLRNDPERLLKAMNDFVRRDDYAGYHALYWFAKAYKEGGYGLPKDAAKSDDFYARGEALGKKLRQQIEGK
ncbi:MAG: hypothetical protein RL250_1843 [Verrucomicrobiota bacterium]|jgi:hypothetical protein